MNIIVEGERRIRFEMAGADFDISSEGPPLSPYHLLAGSLASCTALVLAPWAKAARIAIDALTISVAWEVIEGHPKRITRISMDVQWPGLPPDRLRAAERVADLCPIHATLTRATEVTRAVTPR